MNESKIDFKIEDKETLEDKKPNLCLYLFNNHKNLINTIVLSFIWMCIAIIYFGMTIGKIELSCLKIIKPYDYYYYI